MEFSKSHKKESCKHEEYCHFSQTVCVQTDFQQHCHMKDASLEEMHLLGVIKDRVERDHQWQHDHEEELKEHARALEELANLRTN